MLSLGKTACGAKPIQTNRRGLRLQAQPGLRLSDELCSSPRKTPAPAPVLDADSMPALCMHGINKKGLPAKTGKPFYLFSGGDGGNRTRVRKHSTDSSTYLALSFNLTQPARMCTLWASELPII